MNDAQFPGSASTFFLLPPYARLIPVREVADCPDRGLSVVWFARDAVQQAPERDWLARRPVGVELVVVLPPPAQIRSALPLLRELNDLYPRGILPTGLLTSPEPIRLLLGSAPRDIASYVVAHLTRAGILRDQRIRGLIGRIIEMAADVPSISRLSRKLYTSRRTLGRYFEAEGLPVPSHWLQFGRLMHVAALIQERQDLPVFKAAVRVGYPDGFTMSNQMKRLIGCRPSDVRENLGYEWIVEEWLKRERVAGRLQVWSARDDASDFAAWLKEWPGD